MELKATRGTRDILPPEVQRWRRVEQTARETFALYGFEEIRTPIFEDSRVFEKGTGEASDIVQKEMYSFEDLGGNVLTLRPEGTPPVVRAYLEHHLEQNADVDKLYYVGPMFRYERPQSGRYRQFHQVGVEVFGSEAAALDAEVVDMAMDWLEGLQVSEPRLTLNSVGDASCRPRFQEALLEAQRERLDELCDDCRRRHQVNPLRVFDCKVESCQPVIAELPTIQDHLCDDCRAHFDEVLAHLERWGVVAEVDFRLVRGLDYYRRTVFEVTSAALGAQNALLGGGRYDGLVSTLGGPDIPGVGFAAGLERIVAAMPEGDPVPPVDVYLATIAEELRPEALDLMRELRGAGIRCSTDYQGRSLRAQMRSANRIGAPAVIVLGPDELESGRYGVKRMADGHQVEAGRSELPAAIGELLGR